MPYLSVTTRQPTVAKNMLDLREQPLGHHAVEALAVVVDHPPEIADVVLPALEQRLVDIALVELGVADDRHHPARRLGRRAPARAVARSPGSATRTAVIGGAQPDRAGGEVDAPHVLGPRRVGLRAAERAKALEVVARLAPNRYCRA